MSDSKYWKCHKQTFTATGCNKTGWIGGHVPIDLCPHLWELFESRILDYSAHIEVFSGIRIAACRSCAAVFSEHYNNAKVAGRFIGENNFRTVCQCEIEDLIQPNAVWEHDEESTAFEKIREMELRLDSIDSKLKYKASKYQEAR